jgi:hypothetical protein
LKFFVEEQTKHLDASAGKQSIAGDVDDLINWANQLPDEVELSSSKPN